MVRGHTGRATSKDEEKKDTEPAWRVDLRQKKKMERLKGAQGTGELGGGAEGADNAPKLGAKVGEGTDGTGGGKPKPPSFLAGLKDKAKRID